MTTLQPRGPYTAQELETLYPKGLQLQLVQILLRHGERSPVSPRFMNAGLQPNWPYCNSARQMVSTIMTTKDWSQFGQFKFRRRLETFGEDDSPVLTAGPGGEFDGICNPGELTDKGRETTLALGERLRHLYVDQLGFMPPLIADADMLYLRCTPIPRALESLQQAFTGLYPLNARTASFPPPTILYRTPGDETLYPNDGNCRRFAQLSRAFAQRAADRWNDTDDMRYLTKQIGKWMPPNTTKAEDGTMKESPQKVAVDSHPRLSGIMDTVNSTRAHGKETKLPKEFYDPKFIDIIERIGVEEWFAGYTESNEYRQLGIGSLMGDIVTRMAGSVEGSGNDGLVEIGGRDQTQGIGRGGEKAIKMGLSGCHDTTLAACLASLGSFDGEKWPPYTSHIAFEMFRKDGTPRAQGPISSTKTKHATDEATDTAGSQSWWSKLFGLAPTVLSNRTIKQPKDASHVRRAYHNLAEEEKAKLEGYFVRVRFNDRVMKVPGCKMPGKHYEGDDSFCTLAAFKSIVDAYTPTNWKEACSTNLDKPAFPQTVEQAGYPAVYGQKGAL